MAKTPKPKIVYRSPCAVVWAIPDSGLSIMWVRPGGGLLIGRCLVAGGSVTRIDHPTANGFYETLPQASAAVAAFLASGLNESSATSSNPS
jgi:hypothetical protein